MTKTGNYLSAVRAQYEELPYPRRNPEHEKKRLVSTWGDRLDYLNHFGFAGRMPARGLRVLDAGAGSGDATIFLAEQLRDFGGEVVHLDMSTASIAVAKERARIRGVTNIEFVHASLLDIPSMALGSFDYVTSTGVLHHLADPKAGLDALNTCLSDDGVLQIMVYGRYGRTWIYHMQALMRRYNDGIDPADINTRLARCKEMMAELAGRDWYDALMKNIVDVKTMGDVGIYDLFLHSQDRAYTIPELYDFVEESGLVLHHYTPSPHRLTPAALPDSPLKTRLCALDRREQQALMELMLGDVKMHIGYLTRAPRGLASPHDEEMIPAYTSGVRGIEREIKKELANASLTQTQILVKGEGITLPLSPVNRALLAKIDGKRTIGEIVTGAAAALGSSDRDALKRDFAALCAIFDEMEWLLLRHKSLPAFPLKADLQKRVSERYAT